MLGQPSYREVIKEPFASQLRDKLERYIKGEFNEEELKQQERSKKILSEYECKWSDNKNGEA